MSDTELIINDSDPLVPVVTLKGRWDREGNLPDISCLESTVAACEKYICLVPGEEFFWDSRVSAFLLAVERLCSLYDKTLHIGEFPEAIRHLHELACAVPPNTNQPPEESVQFQFLHTFYREVIDTFAFIGDMSISTLRLLTGQSHMRAVDAIACLNQAGPKAIGILSLLSILVGMILAYLGMIQLSQLGAEVYVANLVAVGMVREMGALMTAVIMAGRTGAAWAAELGAMQVNEEVDALVTMGIRPMDFLVMPRLLAMAIVMPLLCAYSFVLGMVGGGLMATGMNMTIRQYVFQLLQSFTPVDVIAGCFKGFIFGLLIVLAGCQAGMNCRGSSAAVGQATTRAVVLAIVFFVIADAGLNLLFFKLGI